MGKKVLQTSLALSFLASALTLFALTQPMHLSSFALGVPLIKMQISLTTVSFKTCGAAWGIAGWVASKVSDMCHRVPKENDLHTFSQTTCTGAPKLVFPSICTATQQAYLIGMMLIFACVLNVILQLVASFMAYQYIASGKFKKEYRQVSAGLMALGTLVQFMAVCIYYILALQGLANMTGNPALGLKVGSGVGVRPGFIALIIAVILQMIAFFLTQFFKVGREAYEEDRRLNAKFMEEVDMYNEGGTNYGAAAAPQATLEPQTFAEYGQSPDTFGLPPPQPVMGMQQPVQQPGMQPAW